MFSGVAEWLLMHNVFIASRAVTCCFMMQGIDPLVDVDKGLLSDFNSQNSVSEIFCLTQGEALAVFTELIEFS